MGELFRNVLNASVQGGVVIAAGLILRLVLKKAPKKYICLLWILAGLRLLMPFSIESNLSLQPQREPVTQEAWQELNDYGQILPEDAQFELPQEDAPVVTPVAPVEQQAAVPPEQAPAEEAVPPQPEPEVGIEINWVAVAPWVWIIGMGGMALYSTVSYGLLKRRVREAVRMEGFWESAAIDTAFILGCFRPRIYLPMGLTPEEQAMILCHEKTHLKRLDHWTKLIGFVALAVHWFNPLAWIAFFCLCRDIELACDEQVVDGMELPERKAYSTALLRCSSDRRHLAACPVAFGEKPVKRRIKAVLHYKKPAFWLTLCAVAAIVFVAVALLTSPREEEILRAGYAGPNEPYEYYHSTEREQKWEEDILYLAEMMLTKHPRLYEGNTYIYHGIGTADKEFTNAMYDAEIRQAFIDGIDTLIPKLSGWSDDRIPLEINRVLATVGDVNAHINNRTGEFPDISVEPIWNGTEVSYHLVDVPVEHEELLFGELTAINGIPTDQIVERLMTCVAPGYDRWAVGLFTGNDFNSYLLLRGGLEAAEVIGPGAESLEITVKTDAGEQTVIMPILTVEGLTEEKNINKSLYLTDLPPYRYLMDQNRKDVWCTTLEDAVYLQIINIPEGNTEFDQALIQTVNALRDAEKPMKLIIDLRWFGDGTEPFAQLSSFAAKVNGLETDGVYILIDNQTWYHGPAAAYQLRQQIEGALLVGGSTGDSLNRYVAGNSYQMPNSGLLFGVMERYSCVDESFGNGTVQPDIPVQQTLEDYKNGIDTMFQYALDAGEETAVLPREQTLQNLYRELERIQNSEQLTFTVSTTLENFDVLRGHEQTFWVSGDDWYRVWQMDTRQGSYTEEYLQKDGKFYARRDADNIPRLGSMEWVQFEDGYAEELPLLTRDWTACEVLEVRKEKSSDGGVVSVVVQGDMEQTPERTYYEHTHEFHLDEDGRLVGMEEYSFADKYMNYLGTEGRFYIRSQSHLKFTEAETGEVEDRIEAATEEVRAVLGAE